MPVYGFYVIQSDGSYKYMEIEATTYEEACRIVDEIEAKNLAEYYKSIGSPTYSFGSYYIVGPGFVMDYQGNVIYGTVTQKDWENLIYASQVAYKTAQEIGESGIAKTAETAYNVAVQNAPAPSQPITSVTQASVSASTVQDKVNVQTATVQQVVEEKKPIVLVKEEKKQEILWALIILGAVALFAIAKR
jgi:hypothetical protein